MKITALECLHADAGPRSFDFLKISTDEGLIGWSEYNESFGGKGVTSAIERFEIVGMDPRAYEAVVALLYAIRRARPPAAWSSRRSGDRERAFGHQGQGARRARLRAVRRPVRERIRLYWSHCGTYRLSWSEPMQIPPLRTLDDVVAAGKEVVANGYTALKTNIFLLADRPRLHAPASPAATISSSMPSAT